MTHRFTSSRAQTVVAALMVVDALPLSIDAVDEVIPRSRTVGNEAQSHQYPECPGVTPSTVRKR